MKKIVLLSILVMLPMEASAYRSCNGLITSNNSCIGSESNVDSWDNHEPFDTDERIDEHTTHDIKRQRTSRPTARAPVAVAPPIAAPAPPVAKDCAPCTNAAPSPPSAEQDATTTDTKTQTSTQTTPTAATTTTTTTTTTKTTTTKQR